MERTHEGTGPIPMNIYANDFGVIDFVNETNFDHFIDLIRGENEPDPIVNFSSQVYGDCGQRNNLINGCLADGQLIPPAPGVELFDFNVATSRLSNVSANYCVLDEFLKEAEEDEDEDDDESSGTTINTSTPRKKKGNKGDRSRTLVSERKRRGRMKEKLYMLRSLVPNITKMDKASIVGDAVLYVQDLQKQAKKLKSDIANLESSLKAGDNYKGRTTQSPKKMNPTNSHPIIKKIIKMDIYQLEERAVYVRIVSNKGKGVAVFLYKALESLIGFNVRSSNLAASAENYVFTFTLNILESEMDMRLPNLKLWIASAFLDQGFDFQTLLSD